MRDVSKVFRGVSLAEQEAFAVSASDSLTRLFMHECDRVFGDRLTNAQDMKLYSGLLEMTVKEEFNANVDKLKANKPLLFGDIVPFTNKDGKVKSGI